MPKYGFGTPWFIKNDSFDGLSTEQYVDKTVSPYQYYYAYSLEEADGTMHPLAGASGETIDGSGTQYIGRSGVDIRRDGVRSGLEDTNGNVMNLAFQSIGNELIYTTTDTLGRTWTETDQSSDVSGCPTVGGNAPFQSIIRTIPGPSGIGGGLRTYKLCYAHYTLNNTIAEPYIVNATVALVTAVILPDGTNWRFNYDNTLGDLIAVYPPTGGSITYTWETVTYFIPTAYEACLRVVTQRTVNDGTNSYTWKYNPQGYLNGVAGTIIVTDPLANDTVYTQGGSPGGVTTQIQYYSGSSSGGTLLKTVAKSYEIGRASGRERV
jgi:YD repeat-containing protein